MRITYVLSNRQRKTLLDLRLGLELALPAPPIDVPDAAAWARTVLPPDVAALVRAADESEILAAPQPSPTAPASLADLLGQIRPDDQAGGVWCVWVGVVVVRLAASPDWRFRPGVPLQWPANVEVDGRPLIGQRKS